MIPCNTYESKRQTRMDRMRARIERLRQVAKVLR